MLYSVRHGDGKISAAHRDLLMQKPNLFYSVGALTNLEMHIPGTVQCTARAQPSLGLSEYVCLTVHCKKG
jgi:hypothetical protein